MVDGPPYTILKSEKLPDGRVRVLVRKRGGRLVRLVVGSRAADGPTITTMIEQVLSTWPDIPDPKLTEG